MKKDNTQEDIDYLQAKDQMNTEWVKAWVEAVELFLYLDNKLYALKKAST